MQREKLLEIQENLVTDRENFLSAFRQNMFLYLSQKEITIREISESSGVSFSTLNNFLYGKSDDMKLSTVVPIARALNVSVDELIGSGTIDEDLASILSPCRSLSPKDKYFIRWYADYLKESEKGFTEKEKTITVMKLSDNMKLTNDCKKIEISSLESRLYSTIFFGISVSKSDYMPLFSPFDTLLIANDRNPRISEICVIRVQNFIRFYRKIGSFFCSLKNDKPVLKDNEIDDFIGYVACII